jgi:hypothetical protein
MTAATRKSCSFKKTNTASAYGAWVEKSLYLFLAMVLAQVVFVAFAQKARHSMVAHLHTAPQMLSQESERGTWFLCTQMRALTGLQISNKPSLRDSADGEKMHFTSRALLSEGRKGSHDASRLTQEH